MPKIKHKNIKTLKKKLWKIFSEYVRKKENGVCFTCGVRKDYKEMNAGHYIHKDCLDFDERNVHCQCPRCNLYLSGNLGVYAEKMIDKYGRTEVAILRNQSQVIKKWTVDELESLIQTYQEGLNNVL
jgi:hypothetical protein